MSCNECVTYHDYYSDNPYSWCTNCGNYGIAAALKRSLVNLNLAPHQVLLAFDIGCNGNGSDKIQGYRFHGLHGRVLPFAAGAAIANPDQKVIASAGDGATLSEGINHLIHTIRHNYNFTFILHNNSNYGLTTGQASQTTRQGVAMNTSPDGVDTEPMNVSQLVLNLNPSFYARTFSGNVHQMQAIFTEAIKHKGFAFVEVLQACPTYNRVTPHEWYMERIYDTFSISNYDNTNLAWAREITQDLENHIATGIIYHNPRPDYLQNVNHADTRMIQDVKPVNIANLVSKFS